MRVCFVDFSTRLNSINDLTFKPRGGMISSLFKVTDYLAQYMDVWVWSDIQHIGCTKAGVKWTNEVPRGTFDVLVANRGTGNGYPEVDARSRVLWTHDLPHSGFIPEPQIMGAFKYTVFMSRYGERIWRAFYRTIGKSVFIPNGVDKEIFYPREKDLDYLVYFSHPNRGLKRLPLIFDSVKTRINRDIRLNAFSGGGMYPTDKEVLRDHCDGFEIEYKSECEGFEVKKPLPQHKLAEEVGKAGLCIMPTGYPEICSNSVLQALASGTPIVTTGGLGATQEWVKHKKNGLLTSFQPQDYMIHSIETVRNAVAVLSNEDWHRELIKKASKTKIFTWQEIGKKWKKLLRYC